MDERGLIYLSIAETLREWVRNGKYPSGRLPSERTLAETFDANRLTVRKALKLLERERVIHRKSTRGAYVGEGRGAGGRVGADKAIAFVLCRRDKMDPFHSATLSKLETEAGKRGWRLLLFQLESAADVVPRLAPLVAGGSLDGVIFTGLTDPATAVAIHDLGLPNVLMGRLTYLDPIEEALDRVVIDSVGYAAAATRYLLERGHRRVALINGPSYRIYQNITQGYMRALAEAGVPYRENLVVQCEAATAIAGAREMERLSRREAPDAAFAADERLFQGMAFALMNAGPGAGRTIREAIRPSNDPGEDLAYPFATAKVLIDAERLASAAIETLIARFADPDRGPIVANVRDFAILGGSSLAGVAGA